MGRRIGSLLQVYPLLGVDVHNYQLHAQLYKSQEEKAERWQRLAWLRKQAQMNPQQQQLAQEREEAEEADSQQEEAEGTSGLQVRVLYDDEEGLENVERVLEGMVASEGGRTLSLKVRPWANSGDG